MHPTSNLKTILATCLLVAAPLSACAPQDEAAEIDSAVNQLNGGLDMEDEAAQFGDAPAFAAAQLEEESDVDDSIANDTRVVAMGQQDGAEVFHAALRWGQIPFDMDADTPRDWSGTISVNRGAIIIRRAIAFEPLSGDRIEPRDNPRSFSFESTTLPANDGLRVTIIDPEPSSLEPLVLDYSDESGSLYSVDLRELVAGPQSQDVDDAGNRIVAIAFAKPAGDCEFGYMGGRWHRVSEKGGRLLGRIRAVDGEVIGHMRGIYGQRNNGNKVLFGKFINTEGTFRGLFAGRYQGGHFRGLWLTKAGALGALGGQYRETIPGPEMGGHYLGRWANAACRVNVSTTGDVPTEDTP